MKIWLDSIRPAPLGFIWCKSVNEAKSLIENTTETLDIVDTNTEAGSFANDGGDYINLLLWLEETHRSCAVHIHARKSDIALCMRAIIIHNKWREI